MDEGDYQIYLEECYIYIVTSTNCSNNGAPTHVKFINKDLKIADSFYANYQLAEGERLDLHREII